MPVSGSKVARPSLNTWTTAPALSPSTRTAIIAGVRCASRTAILTGVHATKTGVYYNNQAYRRVAGIGATVAMNRAGENF